MTRKRLPRVPFDPITRRVRQALYTGVGRILDETPNRGEDRGALGRSTFRRLQGAYGAAVRKMATERPDLTGEDLFAVVIAPMELPNDLEVAAEVERIAAGVRDRARRSDYGPVGDWADDASAVTPESLAELHQAVAAGALAVANRQTVEPERTVDPATAAEFDKLRAAMRAGRQVAPLD